jgi:porphobilinogen synthase
MTIFMAHSLDIPIRLRRNRKSESIRKMIQETHLRPSDLVVPLFLIEGVNEKEEIPSLPGVYRWSIDRMIQEACRLYENGVRSVLLFPVIAPHLRSEDAAEAWREESLLYRGIFALKEGLPDLCVMADVALDPFTTHGHDGLVNAEGEILNDETIACLIQMALMQAKAGIDFIAPSDMMDGRVRALRKALDLAGHKNVGIVAYSAKYASALYGPFRAALQTNLSFGDKKTYQMDPANVREALLEARLDEEEGADILMVKPALYYLDVIAKLREKTHRPIAAYHVSGEYAMVIAAHERGWLDARKVFHEALLSIKRSGADLIFTYAANWVLDCM